MSRVLLLLPAAILAACARPSLEASIPARLAPLTKECLQREGEVREHCVLAAVATVEVSGTEWLSICDALATESARDICFERAVWTERDPAPTKVCKRIDHARTRQSCLLGGTNAILSGPFEALVETCAAAEDLEVDCIVHVLSGRRPYWTQQGLAALEADAALLIEERPHLASSTPVGTEFARAMAPMVTGGNAKTCELFDEPVRVACNASLRR